MIISKHVYNFSVTSNVYTYLTDHYEHSASRLHLGNFIDSIAPSSAVSYYTLSKLRFWLVFINFQWNEY